MESTGIAVQLPPITTAPSQQPLGIQEIPLRFVVIQTEEDAASCSFICILERIYTFIHAIFESIKSCFSSTASALTPSSFTSPASIGFTAPIPSQAPSQPPILIPAEEIEKRQRTWQQKLQISYGPAPLIDRHINLAGDDPVSGVCSPVGLSCVPYIGRYQADYPMAMNNLVIRLPKDQLRSFPQEIQNKLAHYPESHLDLFFIIYSAANLKTTDPRTADGQALHVRNLIYHTVAFPNLRPAESKIAYLAMGIFNPQGLREIEQAQYGIKFGDFSSRCIYFHPAPGGNGMCISPNEARFLTTEEPISTFYSATALPDNRAAAVYGVVLNEDDTVNNEVNKLYTAMTTSTNLEQFLQMLRSEKLNEQVLKPIEEILSFQLPLSS